MSFTFRFFQKKFKKILRGSAPPYLINVESVQKVVKGSEPLFMAPDRGRIGGHQAIALRANGQDLFVEDIGGGSHSSQADQRGNGFWSRIKVPPPVHTEQQGWEHRERIS